MKNVILLTIDTLRKDMLGIYGNQDGLTPFMDLLANKCIKFTRAQTVAPYTQASFPGILTSSYYFDYPVSQDLSPNRTLVSEVLSKADIATAGFHSNLYMAEVFGWNRGWDVFYDSLDDDVDDFNPYIKGGVINSKVDAWLSSYTAGNSDKPFFLWTHYMDVHEPYVPGKKYIDMIDSSIDLTEEQMFALFTDVVLKRDASDKQTVQLLKKLYCAHVREIDDYTAEFFGILKKHGVLQNSVVIITTDHGDEFDDHGALSHDGKMYSELIDAPLLIYDESLEQSRTSDKLVSGIDISPTILGLFGLEPEAKFQGHCLLPLENYPAKGCFGEAIGKLSHRIKETDKPVYFYRRDDVKIIYHQEADSWQMYDLQKDPKEQNNIMNELSLAEEMKNKLKPRINRNPE